MNFERVLDHVLEHNDTYAAYIISSINYRKKHGCGAYFDLREGMSEDKQRLYSAYQYDNEQRTMMYAMLDILDYDREQNERLYKAARALKKWHDRDNWEHCPSSELIDRLEKWVTG